MYNVVPLRCHFVTHINAKTAGVVNHELVLQDKQNLKGQRKVFICNLCLFD